MNLVKVMPESQYYFMVDQSTAMLQRIRDKKISIRHLQETNGKLKSYYDFKSWENMLSLFAFLSVKTLEVKFFGVALVGEKPPLHDLIFTRKVLITVSHIQERISQNEQDLRFFFECTDTDSNKTGRRLLTKVSSIAEKLFSFSAAIPLFHEDTVKPELLEYVISGFHRQMGVGSFCSELENYLKSLLELMDLLYFIHLQNFDILSRYITDLSTGPGVFPA